MTALLGATLVARRRRPTSPACPRSPRSASASCSRTSTCSGARCGRPGHSRCSDATTSTPRRRSRRALTEAAARALARVPRGGADGRKSGRAADQGRRRRTIAHVELESPEAMNVALARASSCSGSAARPGCSGALAGATGTGLERPRRRDDACSSRASTATARAGSPSRSIRAATFRSPRHPTFAEVLSLQAQVIAVDIPIDPPGRGARPADAGGAGVRRPRRASSVFPTPPRAALEARTFAEANEIARTITGKGISQQAFALGRKILEVQSLAEADERVIEMHPEVSFCAARRRAAAGVEAHGGRARPASRPARDGRDQAAGRGAGRAEADLLDAAVGAWTAARYARARPSRSRRSTPTASARSGASADAS